MGPTLVFAALLAAGLILLAVVVVRVVVGGASGGDAPVTESEDPDPRGRDERFDRIDRRDDDTEHRS